jgi:hypothetical protein
MEEDTFIIYQSEIPDRYTKENILHDVKYLNNICTECGSADLDTEDPQYHICNVCGLCE